MKMDIVIKSFNRPYYLDRCITSINKNVIGDYRIIILDDGTPIEHLNKILTRFPDITLKSSPLADEKRGNIAGYIKGHSPSVNKSIPGEFWFEQIGNASSIFFLIEDDIWLTNQYIYQYCVGI